MEFGLDKLGKVDKRSGYNGDDYCDDDSMVNDDEVECGWQCQG